MKALQNHLTPSNNPGSVWALWNLNGTITADLLDRQFEQLMAQHFDGVVLRASSDIYPSYLSDEFLQLFAHITAKIAAAGKLFMLGDDFSRPAPSLFASTITQSASFRAMRLSVDEYVDLEKGETYTCTPEPHSPFYLVAVPLVHHRISLEGAITIGEGTHLSEQEITWKAPEGDWRVIRFVVQHELNRDGAYMANMFSMKGAQSYCTNTLDFLYNTFTTNQKKAFHGVVCELPALVPSIAGIPWDEELLISKYRSRFKRNLIETVPALFFPVDEKDAKYRPHIYNFLQDTLYERFPLVIQKWASTAQCEAWILGPDSDRKEPESSLSPLLALTTRDILSSGISNRSVSALSQVAFATCAGNNLGIEGHQTIGVAGRDITMASFTMTDLKMQLDQLILHGAHKLLIDGFRANYRYRHEETTPPGVSFHHPDFSALGAMIQQIRTTLHAVRSQVVPQTSVAVIYPSQSALADYRPNNPEVIKTCTERFMTLIASLQAQQIPYTIINENDLADCTIPAEGVIEDPKRKAQYNGVILPYARLINNSLFVFLEKLAIKKGLIIFVESAPIGSFDDGQSKSFVERVQRMVGARSKRVFVEPVVAVADLCKELIEHQEPLFGHEVTLPGLLYKSTAFDDSSLHFLLNTAEHDCVIPFTALDDAAYYEIDGQGMCHPLDLGDDMQLVLSSHASALILHTAKEVACGDASLLETQINSYRLRIKEEKWHFTPHSLNNLPLTRWSSRISINRQRGNLLHYYETFFDSERTIKEGYLLFLDKTPRCKEHLSEHFKVSLNGTVLKPIHHRSPKEGQLTSFFDNDSTILAFDIRESLIKGNNRLLVLSSGHEDLPNPIAFPPFISLAAPIEQTPKGWKILKDQELGYTSWNEQAFPFLVGVGEYQHFFEVPAEYQRIMLNFTKVSGTVEVEINGVKLKKLATPPYRVDITEHVNNKRNNLVVLVRNSLTPITRLDSGNSGILGEVYMEVFE